MPLSVGDKLGPYEIIGLIGAGGMGEVWKAWDTRLDRIVARSRPRKVGLSPVLVTNQYSRIVGRGSGYFLDAPFSMRISLSIDMVSESCE